MLGFKKNIFGSEQIGGQQVDYSSLIISAWEFENNLNDTFLNNNGVGTSISYVNGLLGDAVNFSASSDSKILINDTDDFSFWDGTSNIPFSFSSLIRWNTVGNTMFVNKRTEQNTEAEYQFLLNNSNLQLNFFTSDVVATTVTQAFTPQIDTWYHIGFSYDGNTIVKIAVNGVVYTSTVTLRNHFNGGANLVIGKHNVNTNFSLDGTMDEIKFFNTSLNDNQWLQISNIELSGNRIY